MNKFYLPIRLNFFSESSPPPPNDPTPPLQPQQPSQPPQPNNDPPAKPNYEELFKSDTDLQNFISSQVSSATKKAVQAALDRQKRLMSDKLTEEERLRNMNPEEKADYYRNKFEQAEAARQRDREVEKLKGDVNASLAENKVPGDFLALFDFDNLTPEAIEQHLGLFSKYEIYPKGEFDAKVELAVNEKLKQKPPETHTPGADDPLTWQSGKQDSNKPWNRFTNR